MSFYSIIITCVAILLAVLIIVFLKKNPDIKEYFASIAIDNLIKILVVAGIFYGFIAIFRNTNTVSGGPTIYVNLTVALILLFQATNKVPASTSIKSVVITIRNYLALILVASGFLYWHISKISQNANNFETWIISLDIILAHAVITIPMLQWFYYLFKNILQKVYEPLLSDLLDRFSKSEKGFTIYYFLHKTIHPSFAASLSLGLIWLLLIKTADLQNILFGKYNYLLGWESSTSYRFSVLFEQLKVLFGNQALATIIGFATFAISLILSFSSLLSAMRNIKSELWKTTDESS